MNVPPNVANPTIYRRAVRKVTESYGTRSSAYRSMAIVKTYKGMGGTYKKPTNTSVGTTRWLKEKWIQVLPYLLNGQVKPCGSSHRRKHACRPLVRVSTDTPITINETIRRHGKQHVRRLAQRKRGGASRVRWA